MEDQDASDQKLREIYLGWKVSDLRDTLKAKGLATDGRKQQLVERLIDDEVKNGRLHGKKEKSDKGKDRSEDRTKMNPYSQGQFNVLIFDEVLQTLPWESLPMLRGRPCSRVPSLHYLLHRAMSSDRAIVSDRAVLEEFSSRKLKGKTKGGSRQEKIVTTKEQLQETKGRDFPFEGEMAVTTSARKSWFVVDPEGNLPRTRATMMDFLDPLARR